MEKQKKIKLLIVDDNIDDRMIYRDYINDYREGAYDIQEAQNGEDGLELCSKEDFDCILLDYNLPDMNGFTFYEKLRVGRPKINLPMVMLTGQGDESIASESIKKGFLDYLPKDRVNEESLVRVIDNAIVKLKLQIERDGLIEKLEKTNDRMKRFIGIVSHDLRTPLGHIQSLSDLVFDMEEGKEKDECLKMIKDSGKRALDLVSDLLDLTALEAGKVMINKRGFYFKDLNKELYQVLNPLARRKQVSLEFIDEGDSQVYADEKRIHQVLQNLISNAIKFSNAGGNVQIHIKYGDNIVLINVKDAGVGITEDKVNKLFAKDERTSTPGTNGEMGTGFGLPLSQELIRAHGSEIKVESTLGKGSRFYFELPASLD